MHLVYRSRTVRAVQTSTLMTVLGPALILLMMWDVLVTVFNTTGAGILTHVRPV